MNKMRKYIIIAVIIALSLAICPAAAVGGEEKVTVTQAYQPTSSQQKREDVITVMSTESGKISEIEMREYLVGCVAAEMPSHYHTQAIMAQAVASYTYAKRTSEQNRKDSTFQADITDSPDTHQGYINEEKRRQKWGENFEENEAKITAAVNEIYGKYLTFEGQTALTLFHSISAGVTQSAKSLWNSEIPYLSSVTSIGDKLSPDFRSEYKFSENEIKELAESNGISLESDAGNWLGKVNRSDDGYVISVELGGREISGAKIREKLNLRSNFFEIYYSGGEFAVECCGYGHCVGMSQYGADYMARQGSSWQEILMHYYPGTQINNDNI